MVEGTLDYPLIRSQAQCPGCGRNKPLGGVFCWPCQRIGKAVRDYRREECDAMEKALAAKVAPATGRSASKVIELTEYCDAAALQSPHRFPWPITVQRISGSDAANNTTYRVRYGFDISHGTYEETCKNLGAAIMHALNCEGEFDAH